MNKFQKFLESFKDNAYIWDVDDTLFTSAAMVLVKDVDGNVIEELSPQEYNTYKLQQGEEFDFSQFRNPEVLLKTAEKTTYFKVIEKMNAAIQRGDSDSSLYILTARGDEIIEGLRKLLNNHGITNIKQIFAVGEWKDNLTIAERKKKVLSQIVKRHKGQVTFFDDDIENIKLARQISGIKARLVKTGPVTEEISKENGATMILNEDKYLSGEYGFDKVIELIKGKTLVFFDTETTGLDPNVKYVQVTEIAGVAYDSEGKELDTFHKKSNLTKAAKSVQGYEDEKGEPFMGGKGKTISDLNKMTGYEDDNAGERMDEVDMLKSFNEWVESFPNPIIIAQNLEFDMKQISTKVGAPKTVDTLDTLKFARIFMTPILYTLKNNPEIKAARKLMTIMQKNKWGRSYPKLSHTLEILGKVFNVKTNMWHSAIADTQQLAGIFFGMLGWYEKHKDELDDNSDEFDNQKRRTIAKQKSFSDWQKRMNKKNGKGVRDANKKFDKEIGAESLNREVAKRKLQESIKQKFIEMPMKMDIESRPLVANWGPSKWMHEVQWTEDLGSHGGIQFISGKGMMGMVAIGALNEQENAVTCMAKTFQVNVNGDMGAEAKVPKIIEIGTDPEYRGKGIAGTLHDFCIKKYGGVASDNSLFESKPGANDGMVGLWTKRLPNKYPCYVCNSDGTIIDEWKGGELDGNEATILVAMAVPAEFTPKTQESVMTEMPHVNAPTPGGAFDLGLEFIEKTSEGLIDYITKLFSGIEVPSAHKEVTLKLDSPEKKQEFWNDLKTDSVFPLYIKKNFDVTIEELGEELGYAV